MPSPPAGEGQGEGDLRRCFHPPLNPLPSREGRHPAITVAVQFIGNKNLKTIPGEIKSYQKSPSASSTVKEPIPALLFSRTGSLLSSSVAHISISPVFRKIPPDCNSGFTSIV